MRTTISPLIWILSLCISFGEVAVLRIQPDSIRFLAGKPATPTEQENDPFAKGPGSVPAEAMLPEVANPIASLIPGLAHNLKQGLRNNGIALEDQDLALYFAKKHLVVVRSSPEAVNAIRMFFASMVEEDLHPELAVTLRVREGMDPSSKDVCRLEAVTRSGYKLPVSDTNYEANIELTSTGNEGWVDARIRLNGRSDLAGKSVDTFFMAKTGEEVKVASWTVHEESAVLFLKVEPILHDKQDRSDAQLIELTHKVTGALDHKDGKQQPDNERKGPIHRP